MKRRGFTIVELIIVITIMGILITLGVINFRSTQISSRDAERRTDVETLGQYLDIYYTSGTDTAAATFDYPPTLLASSVSNMFSYLRDLDETVVVAPGIADPLQTLMTATNTNQTTTGVLPQPTYDHYVYQPLYYDGANWQLCTLNSQECKKYNLFYRLETDNTVYKLSSKYQ